MSLEDKIFYNEASASKLGWEPSWFGCDDFDDELIDAIKEFQEEHELSADGLCGPTTFRRIYTEKEMKEEEQDSSFIICNTKIVPIKWDKVDVNSLTLNPGKLCFEKRDVNQFVVHWDATLSSKHCHKILKKRGLSVQFSIDNDGTIYQHTDANHICWHAPPVNYNSIGVEISNAVEMKYQKYYTRKGFPERPVVSIPKINGKRYARRALGFYPIQVEALRALITSLQTYYDIATLTPSEVGLHKPTKRELVEYSGIVSHYHVDMRKRKWDSSCLDLQREVIDEL